MMTIEEQLANVVGGMPLTPPHAMTDDVTDFFIKRYGVGVRLTVEILRKHIADGEVILEPDSEWGYRLTLPHDAQGA